MKKKFAFVGLMTAATLAGMVAVTVQRVRAAGIPSTGTLIYSGTLAAADGTLANGSRNISVALYDSAAGGMSLCNAIPSPVQVVHGEFSVPLPDACTAAISASQDVWLEVQVDGGSLGRVKIGAVPYAIEAAHAVRADSAAISSVATAASGTLASQLSSLTTRVQALESR